LIDTSNQYGSKTKLIFLNMLESLRLLINLTNI